jgi:hypothetical protein
VGTKRDPKKQRRSPDRTDPTPISPQTLPPIPGLDLTGLTSKHQATLADVFADPVRANVEWRDIESLFVALGVEATEGHGSRVRCVLQGIRAVFHRPHPEKETSKGAIRSVRRFLGEAGVQI